MPNALVNRPELGEYEFRVLQKFLAVARLRPEGFNGRGQITLNEIDTYLRYYPVDDVYYFIDLIGEIDRRGINTNSKN